MSMSWMALWLALASAPSPAESAAAIETMNRGVDQALAGDLGGAEQSIRKALEQQPRLGEAWLNLGHVHRRQGRRADAARAFRSGLEVGEGELEVELRYQLGRLLSQDSRDAGLEHEARVATAREAVQMLEPVVKAQPDRAPAWRYLAQGHEQLDELTAADRAYRRAIEADPTQSAPYLGLGLLYIDCGFPNVGIAVLEANVRLNAMDPQAWMGMGRALVQLERNDEAVTALKKAKTLDPELVEAYYLLGKAHAELLQRKESVEMLTLFLSRAGPEVPEHIRQDANNTIARMQDVF